MKYFISILKTNYFTRDKIYMIIQTQNIDNLKKDLL